MQPKSDPPAPPDVTDEDWSAALRAARLGVDASMMKEGMMDRSRLPDTMAEYETLRRQVGEDVFIRASKARVAWTERQRALEGTARMRLPTDDWRAWARLTEPALAHRRMQHAVGQGGLHAGIIREYKGSHPTFDEVGSPSVFYVYDCGSEPRRYVDREIRALIAARAGPTLDFLFLSHFDRDHICGTPRLLAAQNGFQVDTIVLPYVDETERFLAFGRSAQTRGGVEANRFFADMVVDPIASLRQFRPRQIIFVVSGESPMPDLPPSAPPAGLPDRRLAWKATARSEQPETRSVDGQDVVVVRDPIFDILPSGAVAGWQLIPYVDRVSPEVVVNFRRVAEALLNWERDSFGAKVSDPSVRRDLVTRHRSKMARAYRHAFKDKNTTSLSLYSGPAHPSTTGAVQLWPFAPATDTAKVAWMGTGDADLKDHDAIARFERHYRDGMPYVSTFLLPHHGSIHNSNPYKLVSDADRWVASAEPIHPWEHPAQALIDAVSARGRGFQHVKSNQSSAFDEALIVFWPN